jgi:poly-D-alanine transfer protein DltD
VWPYGIQLWGCTKQSNTDIIQRFQNKVLRNIIDAPWYIKNGDLDMDLQKEMVTNEICKFAKEHEERLLYHVDVEAIQLLDNSELVRRLKRNKTF